MNTPGIEFGRKTSAAYAALCKPLCQKLHLPQTAFDILMFLANNPGYQTASDVVPRGLRTEIRIVSTVKVSQMQKQVDDMSRDLRLLEETIQSLNWTTELQE